MGRRRKEARASESLRLFASASKDKTVRVWRADDGSCLHCVQVSKLSLPNSARRPAAGGGDGSSDAQQQQQRVWISLAWSHSLPSTLHFSALTGDICSLQLLRSTASRPHVSFLSSCHQRPVFDLLTSPSLPSSLLSTSMDRQVVQWEEKTGKPSWRCATLGGFVYAMQFQPSPAAATAVSASSSSSPPPPASPASSLLALALGDKSIVLWSAHHPHHRYASRSLWQGIHSRVLSLQWHPALPQLLAYGMETGVVALVDVSKPAGDSRGGGGGRLELSAHRGAVYELGWRRVLSPSKDAEEETKSERVDDEAAATAVDALPSSASSSSLRSAAPSRVSFLLHSLGADGQLLQISISHFSPLGTARAKRRALRLPSSSSSSSSVSGGKRVKTSGFAWHPDGRMLAVGYTDGAVRLFAVQDGDARESKQDREQEEQEAEDELDNNDDSDDDSPPLPQLALLAEWKAHSKLVGFLRWHGSGQSMVEQREVRGPSAWQQAATERAEERRRWPHAFWLAVSSDDGSIGVYDCSEFVLPSSLPFSSSLSPPPAPLLLSGHQSPVKHISWSPHPQYATHLLSACYDNTVQLWDAATGSPLASMRGHDGRVLCCGWSPLFPAVVYSGAEDQTVRVWDITQQKDREPPTAPPQSAVQKDGKDRARTHSREKDRRPGRASGDGRGRKAENGRSRHKSPARQAAAAAHSPAAAVPVVTPLPSVDSSVLPAVSSRGIRPPQSPAMQPVPAVPSTSSFEPDAPLLSINLSASVRNPLDSAPRSNHIDADIDAGARAVAEQQQQQVAQQLQHSRETRAHGRSGRETKGGKKGTLLFGNLLPDQLDHSSILALARSVFKWPQQQQQPQQLSSEPQRQSGSSSAAQPPQLKPQQLKQQQHSSSSPPSSNGNSPNASSPLSSSALSSPRNQAEQAVSAAASASSLFLCSNISGYLTSHVSHQHSLIPLPPFHPPRYASPLSPAATFSSAASGSHPLPATVHPTTTLALIPSLSPYHLPLWQNALPAVIANVVSTSSPLSPHLVALSASAGLDVYHQLCQLYSLQLEREGDYHTAVLYLLVTGDVMSAVRLYMRRSLFGEAAILARSRLMREDALVTEVYIAWAEWCLEQRKEEERGSRRHALVMQAVACFIAGGEMEKALQTLVKCSAIYPQQQQQQSQQQQALAASSSSSLCSEDEYLPLAFDLACLVYPHVLVCIEVFRWYGEWCQMQEEWEAALDAYGRDGHWSFMQCLVMVERLVAHTLHMAVRAQQPDHPASASAAAAAAGGKDGNSSGSSGKAPLPLPSLILQAWMTSSLPLQPLLKSAYSSLAPHGSFPFLSSSASTSVLFRTRANFSHHLCCSCLASMVEPAQSLQHLCSAAFVLYQSGFLSALLSFASNSLSPRLKELKKEERRGLYAVAVFSLLLKAGRERQRWSKRELVMWGLRDYRDAAAGQHPLHNAQVNVIVSSSSSSSSSGSSSASLPAALRPPLAVLAAESEDERDQARALDTVSQQLLFSPAASLQMLSHRLHLIRRYEVQGGDSSAGRVKSREEQQSDAAECEEAMRLLSHQLSVQRDDRQRVDFPSPLESCALLILYAARFCPSVTAATSSMLPSPLPSSSPLHSLLVHCRRWLLSNADYALLMASEQTRSDAAAMGSQDSSPLDVSALLRVCWSLTERVQREVQWESLRAFVQG